MSHGADVPAILQRHEEALEGEMEALLAERQGPLYEMMRYHLGSSQSGAASGKHLRPVLMLMTCELVGGDWREALPAAAAIEFLHNFSLIHDDIQDGSPTRRGQSTLWWRWGTAQAINAGDGMHALARLALWGLEIREPSVALFCGRLLDETCLALCEGQYQDISFQGCEEVTIADYKEMISQKTATLFGTALEIGGILGGAGVKSAAGLRAAGRHLGMAYQVRDDVLDLWGGAGIGKTHATDLRNKKKTLPIVYGLAQSAIPAGQRLQELYRQPALSTQDIAEAVELLEELKAPEFCAGETRRHHDAALAELEAVSGAPQVMEEIKAVAAFLLGREY